MKLVSKVFDTLAKRYSKRNGGYVRILKSGYRYGDSAPKAIIELVDRDENAKGLQDKLRLKNKEESEVNSKDLPENTEKTINPVKVEKKNQKPELSEKNKKTETKK